MRDKSHKRIERRERAALSACNTFNYFISLASIPHCEKYIINLGYVNMMKFTLNRFSNTSVKGILVAAIVLIFVVIVSQQAYSRSNTVKRLILRQDQNGIDYKNREKHLNDIWNYVYHLQYKCTDIEEIGGNPQNRDGFYPVCKEPRFWKPNENGSNEKQKCLVYSFGVGGDFSFDDGVAAKGCEVHSFDPSSPYEDGWVRDSGVTFHKIGIYEHDTDNGPEGWKMRTLTSIIKMLGHEGRMIDILKVDIDSGDGGGYEDLVMNHLILSGMYNCVRQYDVEIHYVGPLTGRNNRFRRCQLIWDQLQFLNRNGFKIFQTTNNVRADPKYTQQMRKDDILTSGTTILWEISFVNENASDECRLFK